MQLNMRNSVAKNRIKMISYTYVWTMKQFAQTIISLFENQTIEQINVWIPNETLKFKHANNIFDVFLLRPIGCSFLEGSIWVLNTLIS